MLGRNSLQIPVEPEPRPTPGTDVRIAEQLAAPTGIGNETEQCQHTLDDDVERELAAENAQLLIEETSSDIDQDSSEMILSYDSQTEIRNTAYELSTMTEFSNYGYIEDVACENSKCEIAVKYTVSDRVSGKTGNFLTEMNERLAENSVTSTIQLGITEISYGPDGNGIARFQTMPRQPPSVIINTLEDVSDER